MTCRVVLAPAAVRGLRRLDPSARRRVQAVVELLADEPHPPAANRLVGGAGEWRMRTGDHRVVYEIDGEQLIVLVLQVEHRREVYQRR